MGALQGLVFCPAVCSKQGSMCSFPVNSPFSKAVTFRSGFWGSQGGCKGQVRVLSPRRKSRMHRTVMCSFSSSSDSNGSMADNLRENDEDYVNSSVVEVVELKSSADGFFIKMRDGMYLRCVHNHPQARHMLDCAPHPTIVAKMENGSDLLPIVVLRMPSVLLMAVVPDVPINQPTLYQITKDLFQKTGYSVKLARVTKRVHEAYFAQLYLAKVGDETERICIDIGLYDAIDIAVRWKVPIQVNKRLAFSYGMRIVGPSKLAIQAPFSDGVLFTELDRIAMERELGIKESKTDDEAAMDEVTQTNDKGAIGSLSSFERWLNDLIEWRLKMRFWWMDEVIPTASSIVIGSLSSFEQWLSDAIEARWKMRFGWVDKMTPTSDKGVIGSLSSFGRWFNVAIETRLKMRFWRRRY